MRLSKVIYIIISIFILVALFAFAAYAKSTSNDAKKELQNATKVAANIKAKNLEQQQILEKKQKLEKLKKLENEKKLAVQKKLEQQKKLDEQKEIAKQKAIASKKEEIASKNKTSSIKQTNLEASTPAATKSSSKLLIDKIDGKRNAKQAIVVTTNGFGNVNATIKTFENSNGYWKQVHSFAGNVGRTGFAYNKAEGDGHTPIGILSLGTAFGRNSNPGTAMNYRQSTPNDFWIDDVNSSLYNTWQKGPASGRWTSAEKMYIPQYNYGFVINYNTANRVPGKGSAIFFHVWSGAGQGTAGCIATTQNNVISILNWLNPSKNPVIIEGPISEVIKM